MEHSHPYAHVHRHAHKVRRLLLGFQDSQLETNPHQFNHTHFDHHGNHTHFGHNGTHTHHHHHHHHGMNGTNSTGADPHLVTRSPFEANTHQLDYVAMTWIITIVASVIVLCGLFSFWMYTRRRRRTVNWNVDDTRALHQPRRLERTLEGNEAWGTSATLGLNQSPPPPAYEEFSEVKR